MLLIDDLIVGPGKFVLWIMRQVHEAAQREMEQEAERISADLIDLHRRLEAGAISEAQFEQREAQLLDRLEELEEEGRSEAESEGK